jgi:hypothetical protein
MTGTWHGHLGITRHVAPKQAQIESEYFLALTGDGPPLFNLIGQRSVFPGRWSYQIEQVVGKRCLDNNDLAKASFKK